MNYIQLQLKELFSYLCVSSLYWQPVHSRVKPSVFIMTLTFFPEMILKTVWKKN